MAQQTTLVKNIVNAMRDKSATPEQRRDTLVVIGFLTNHYGRTLDEDVLETYIEMLYDIPAQFLLAAAKAHIANEQRCAWFPQPGQLRGPAIRYWQASRGILPVDEAYKNLLSEIDRVGHVGEPTLDETTAKAVKLLGGWQKVCLDERFSQAAFTKVYNARVSADFERLSLPPQQRQMLDTKQPLLIGDK